MNTSIDSLSQQYQIDFVMAETENQKKPNIFYPAYINKSRTVAAGRRIPLQYSVADPKPNEVVDALFYLKAVKPHVEAKPYCRELDKESVPWRVKYSTSEAIKKKLGSKREILVACAKRINEVRAKSGPTTAQPTESSGKQKKKKK